MPRKKLVIIGGGFAGLNVAKHADKTLYDVVVVDRNNYHSLLSGGVVWSGAGEHIFSFASRAVASLLPWMHIPYGHGLQNRHHRP